MINPTDKQVDLEIRAEQIRLVHRHLPILMLSNLIIILIVWLVLYGVVNTNLLLAWSALIVVLVVIRLILFTVFQGFKDETKTVLPWGRPIIALAFISGILWGLLAPLATNTGAIPFFAINGILVVMVGVALAPGSSFRPTYLVFAVPVMISVSATTLLASNQYNYFLGLLGLASLGVFIVLSRNIERALIDSIKIRFEKQSLANELQVQKQEADRANLAKSKFLAAASHDLRQPLHALGLYLDTMKATSNIGRLHELAHKMGIAVDALNDLFQRLLDISKLDAGIIDPEVVDFSVGEIFKRLEVRYLPAAKAKDLNIEFFHENEILRTDPVLLERILDNLVGNAIRYTSYGRIIVRSRKKSHNIFVSVSDTGPGIPEEERGNVFNEFYQLQNPERDRTKGLGLGLSIVKRLCSLLDHKLTLESALGQGTTFLLVVPEGKAENIAAPSGNIDQYGWDLKNARILVIDDETGIRDAMHELLTDWGCSPVCVDSIHDALDIISKGAQPDLIIADYRLRDSQTGVDAIHSIKQFLQKKIPAILITGDTAPERLQEAARSGFKLLHKPVNPGQLRMVMNHLLGSPHLERPL